MLEVVSEALGLQKLRNRATGGNAYEAEREQWDDGNKCRRPRNPASSSPTTENTHTKQL